MSSFVRILWWLLIQINIGVNNAHAHDSQLILRQHLGVAFKPIMTITPIIGYWAHTFEVQLPKVPLMRNVSELSCTNQSELGIRYYNCMRIAATQKYIVDMHNNMSKVLADMYEDIQAVVPAYTSKGQINRKRSFSSFVSRILQYTVGTARDVDLQILSQHVSELDRLTAAVASEFAKSENLVGSISKATNDRIDALQHLMAIQHETMVQQYDRARNSIEFERLAVSMVEKTLSNMIQFVKMAVNALEFKESIFHTVQSGHIDSFLVPPDLIQNVLNNITASLSSIHSGFKIGFHSVSDFYKTSNYLMSLRNHTLILMVNIPLSVIERPLVLYKIRVFQVPISPNDSHTTMLDTPYQGLAYAPDQNYFIQFTKMPIHDTHFVDLNDIDETLVPSASETCLTAIFADNLRMVKDLCTFHLLPNSLRPSMQLLDPTTVLMTHVTYYNVTCSTGQTFTKTGCLQCIHIFSCNCSLSAAEAFIPARLESCPSSQFERRNQNYLYSHSTNLMYLRNLFDPDVLQDLTASTRLMRPIETKLPKFQLLDKEYLEGLAVVDNTRLHLQKVTNLSAQMQTIYRSAAEKLGHELKKKQLEEQMENEIIQSESYPIFLIVLVVISGLALILASYNAIRVRILIATIASLRQADAASLTYFTRPTPKLPRILDFFATTSTTSSNQITTLETAPAANQAVIYLLLYAILIAAILMLITVFVFIIYYSCHWRKRDNFSRFRMVVEIGNQVESCYLHLNYLSDNPSNYRFYKGAAKPSFRLSGWVMSHVYINWRGFMIWHFPTKTAVTLNRKAQISCFQANKLKRILRSKFWQTISLQYEGNLHSVKIYNRAAFESVINTNTKHANTETKHDLS